MALHCGLLSKFPAQMLAVEKALKGLAKRKVFALLWAAFIAQLLFMGRVFQLCRRILARIRERDVYGASAFGQIHRAHSHHLFSVNRSGCLRCRDVDISEYENRRTQRLAEISTLRKKVAEVQENWEKLYHYCWEKPQSLLNSHGSALQTQWKLEQFFGEALAKKQLLRLRQALGDIDRALRSGNLTEFWEPSAF